MYGARGWVAHHNTDLWRATAPIDGPQWGLWPMGGAWLLPEPLGTLSVHRRQKVPGKNLSGHEGRGAVLPRHARRGTQAPLARHLPVAVAGKPASPSARASAPGRRWTWKFCATCSPIASRPRKFSAWTKISANNSPPRAPGSRRCKSAPPDNFRNGWRIGTLKAPDIHHRHVSHLYGLFPSDQIDFYTHARTGRRGEKIAGDSRRRGDRLGDRLAHQSLGAPARRRSRLRHFEIPVESRSAPTRTCSTRARRFRLTAISAALPASPKCCCKARTAKLSCSARAAESLAQRQRERLARPRRL